MELLQLPDNFSLLGNMKSFVVRSTEEIIFTLKLGSVTLFEASYAASSRTEIDVRDIIEQYLSFNLKFDVDFYEQTDICRTFTAKINDAVISFTVLRASASRLNDTVNNFLKSNFLTWQPAEKDVSFHSPEWITFYATEKCNLVLEACNMLGSSEQCYVITLGSASAGKVYSANVIASLIIQKLGGTPKYYEIFTRSFSGKQLSNRQRFYLTDNRSEQEEYFLFENSLGGIDSFRAYGEEAFMHEYDYRIAVQREKSLTVDIDVNREHEKNTGTLAQQEASWLYDFFLAKNKYKFHDNGIMPIVVTESNAQHDVSDYTVNYSFKYKLADNARFFNINKYGRF